MIIRLSLAERGNKTFWAGPSNDATKAKAFFCVFHPFAFATASNRILYCSQEVFPSQMGGFNTNPNSGREGTADGARGVVILLQSVVGEIAGSRLS